jgi:hypothetical protein
MGLGEELAVGALPDPWVRQFVYTETLAGAIIGTMPGTMMPGACAAWSPCDYRVAAQIGSIRCCTGMPARSSTPPSGWAPK